MLQLQQVRLLGENGVGLFNATLLRLFWYYATILDAAIRLVC